MNTLQTNTMSVEAALKLAKPYVGSLKKNPGSRAILKTALITEKHVIATNSHFLIRIRHNESIIEPYLHFFNLEHKEYLGHKEASKYPKTERLFPQINHATSSGPISVKEMSEAIEGACVAAKSNAAYELENLKAKNSRAPKHLKKTVDELKADAMRVRASRVYLTDTKTEVIDIERTFETGSFTYTFDNPIPVTEQTAFNPEYLSTIMKTFRSVKEKTVNCYYYGPIRPLYLVAGPIEIIILPVRIN